MLTDQFLNLCCLILIDDNPRFTESVFQDINHILNFYKEENVLLTSKKKYNLAKTICKYRIQRQSPDKVIDSIITAGQFSELNSFIQSLSARKIAEEKVDSALSQIATKKQYSSLLKDLPNIEDFIKKFNTNSFPDATEAIKNWDGLISQLHTRLLEEKRKEARSNVKELDLVSDSYENILNQIEISYSGRNSITTGYHELDSYLNGGFEPTRLYIFGGTSGDGKSVLLNNFLRNAVDKNKCVDGPLNVYVYFTLENLVDESLVRLYCCREEKKISDVIRQYDSERNLICTKLKEWQINKNCVIVMAYFPPTLTSVSDLISFIDLIKHRYQNKAIVRAMYVDYLDLLKSGQTFDLHRLEMGQVTIDLKVAAVTLGIPCITVTQLNRCCSIYSRINIKEIGYTEFKNVKVGDEIEGKSGFRKVLYVYPREKKICYKIKTKSGKEIICGPKHEFPTTSGLKCINSGLSVGDKLYVKNNDIREIGSNKGMD